MVQSAAKSTDVDTGAMRSADIGGCRADIRDPVIPADFIHSEVMGTNNIAVRRVEWPGNEYPPVARAFRHG